MPDFLTIKRQHDAAKSKGLVPSDSSIADFARMGALATDDPSYQQVAESPAWKNMIRSWSASADEAIQSGPVDDWTAGAFGAVGDLFGVTPEASRAAGRELPRQVLNFLPMMAGGAIGMGLTSGLSAFDAYGKGGTTLDAVIGGASPYLGGKLSEFGSKAALRSAATPGSFLNRVGFMKGKDFLNPATHTVIDPVTGVAKQVLGETVDTFRDKALGYVAGEAIANIGFTGLDVIQQGPDAVLNRDYLFANLASNVPFALADLPNFTKTRFAWEPTDAPLRPTQDQINAEKTRAERTRESLDAVDNQLARFNKELELGVDVGRFIDTHNSVAATLEGHRKSVMLAAKEFKLDWDRHRTVKKTLPDILTGIDPAVLLKDPSVISFDPAKALVQEYAQKLKQLNKVKGGNLSRIAKSDTDLDYVMGLVEEDLRLPDTLLSTPVAERTVEQYQKVLGGKLSDNAIKLIRMKHMELAQGESFVPEFPKLWEEHNKALTGKFEGSLDDRYELITASLLAGKGFPKIVKAQKKAAKEAKAEGQTSAEANKNATGKMATLSKAEQRAAKKAERDAEKTAADALNPPAPKNKGGAPKGPRKSTVDKVSSMEERILFAAKALEPTDNERFLLIGNQLIDPDPAVRLKSLSWMQKVADEHNDLPLAQKLAKFQSGLKTLEGRVTQSNEVQTVPLREEITPDPFVSAGEQADIDAAIAERKMVETDAIVESMDELIVDESVREMEEEDLAESLPVQERNLQRDYMVALAKKAGVDITPDAALERMLNMPLNVRNKLLTSAKEWKEKGFPQLAANDIDPLTVHFTTGQPLPIKEFATAWAREAGVPEAEIPAAVEDFVRITQMFAAGESRFGKLEGVTREGAQFARASAGAFDFGMREVKNGQLQRPGKPPLGTKDGWMSELDFRNNGGDINGVLSKDEVNFYRKLVPEAFADGKVHLQKLWDGLGKVGEQVKVVSYGQAKNVATAKVELDRMTHEWYDALSQKQRDEFNNTQSSVQELVAKGWSETEIQKADKYMQLQHEADNRAHEVALTATSYYNQISPFDTKKYPVLRVDVVLPEAAVQTKEWRDAKAAQARGEITQIPWERELWQQDNLHENLPNTLGWAMVQIVPHPVTGEKVMFVGEAQSRWGQHQQKKEADVRRADNEYTASGLQTLVDRTKHPLLPIHQNLILKAVIKEAQKQGISKVAVSDGETAMITQMHDKNVASSFRSGFYTENLALKTYDRLESEGYKNVKLIKEGDEFIVTADPNIRQEGGMRLAYDTTLPSIGSKLAGEWRMEDFGVHKNVSVQPTELDVISRQIDAIDNDFNAGRITAEEKSRRYSEIKREQPGSPVFREVDPITGELVPKTRIKARVFDISNPSDRLNTLFAKGGTVYGAAFKNIAQAFFSTKAFQGPNKTKAMGYVLAHEMGHIAFGKAMRGEYGPETKQLFDEAIAWVKGNDPVVLRDVEEVIRDLYLPKEMRGLDGIRDVLGNTEGEEWMANAHAMMVTGAMQANKPVKALLILPKVLRNAVENTIRRVQDALKHARMYWKLNGDKDKMNQVLRVKAMVDSVRGKFREAEWQTAQAHKFFDIDPAGLMGRMEDAQFARSPYPVEGVKQRVGNWFNNATQGLGGFMATYRSFIEPGFRLLNSGNVVTEQVTESLTPLFGHKGAVDNIVVDKSMPWYKISSSPPLLDLTKRINLEAQDSSVSAIVQNPDGTVSFNWNAMSPEHRAEVKLYNAEQQKNIAAFLMQKEQSTRLTQKHNVEHETNRARLFTVNLVTRLRSFDQGTEPALRHKEARVVAEKLFDGLKTGDQVVVQEALSRFSDPREAQKLVEIIQEKQGVLNNLEKHYANSPNFQSLRRFKPVIQRYTNPAGESKVLDFNKGSEALAMRKELEAKGWKAVGDPIIRDNDKKYRGEFTLDSKVVDLLEGKEGRLKDLIDSMNLDPADRDSLLGESTFLADVLREAKSNDIYLPGVKRRVSGGPEHLDMLEQHLTYTQAAHKVGYMTALGEELKYHMNNPELKDQLREKTQFMEFYKQAKESDPKFWRIVNKFNAVWHIGFNLPGHLAELFQPIQTHIHEAVYQGHSMLTALRTTVGAEKSAMAVIGKLIKSKIGYHDEAALWENWPDKDEADMLKSNWRRSLTQPLQEVYQQVGVNQETLRAITQDRTMPSVSKVLTKPLNMYSNAAMGVYSVFTQHNNLVGLLTGYRLAKKKGLSHEEAVKSAALFELTANNSGGRTERPVYFGKLGSAGYLVYALSSYVRGRFTDLARYYRHGFDKANFPELEQGDRRAARKAFATMIAGQLTAAGLLGFPFIGAGISLMEDLTGDEIKGSGMAALNEMTDDPLLTQALSYGVFSSMAESLGVPADLHSRFSLGGYLGINAYDGISASSVLGPTASMVNSMWKMGKSLAQEKDLGAALRAGGPGGIKKLAEALSEDFQGQNPDANLPLAMAGFRSGKMFRQKEMERIISKTNEAAQRDMTVASKRVEESLMLGPEVAQATLMREANLLIDQKLEGRGRQVALRDMMQNLRQRVATAKVKAQMPTDIRGKATAQTASKVQGIAQAVGYTPPPAGNIEQEQILRSIYGQLGGQRSATSLRNAARRQAELDASPGVFY